MMGDVYGLAAKVVAWLGPEADNSTLAMETFRALSKEAISIRKQGDKTPYTNAEAQALLGDRLFKRPCTEEECEAILSLVCREWFERVWIRQEIGLSYKNAMLMCGFEFIAWNEFYRVVVHSRHFTRAIQCIGRTRVKSYALLKSRLDLIIALIPRTGSSLGSDLNRCRISRCSDPRDRIYALLNLLNTERRFQWLNIVPDYTKSAEEVYEGLARKLFVGNQSLHYLMFCGLEKGRMKMPSWVPDWSLPTTQSDGLREPSCNASGLIGSDFSFLNEAVLRAAGVFIDTIKDSRETRLSRQSGTNDAAEAIPLLAPPNTPTAIYPPNGMTLVEAFSGTLWMNSFLDIFPQSSQMQMKLLTKETATSLTQLFVSKGLPAYQDMSRGTKLRHDAETYLTKTIRNLADRAFMTTRKGYIGLVPTEARTGDLICVLLGCHAPIALRRQAEDRYRVVGPAYVQGLMNGEALLCRLPEPFVHTMKAERDAVRPYHSASFLDTRTGLSQWNDPRYEMLSPLFEGLRDVTYDNWLTLARKATPEMLRANGVDLDYFDLV
jgi:hypothetical protein